LGAASTRTDIMQLSKFARIALVASAATLTSATLPVLGSQALFAQDSGIPVGTKAPGALLETLDGKPIDLKEFIGKKPVMLEFWATWCGNCKELQPRLTAMTKKYAGQMTFVTVAVSANQTPQRVQAWHKLNPIASEMLYDRKGTAADAYDVPATSYVVIINKAGNVVYTGVGGTQDLDSAIKKALN
jgi:thiol-disulfide isomerase/thioredoxin